MTICNIITERITEKLDQILHLRSIRSLKEDGSYITEGDLLCQQIIEEAVGGSELPLELLSEEINHQAFVYDPQKNYIVVDPIDGTENFTSGLKEWGIGISIYLQDQHHQSMIFLPEMDVRLKTGDPVQRFTSRIYGISSSLKRENLSQLDQEFEYRIMGCCMYNMYNVIRGSYAVFENFRGANCWDILPGLNLARENNIEVTVEGKEYHGEFLSPNRKYCFKIRNR